MTTLNEKVKNGLTATDILNTLTPQNNDTKREEKSMEEKRQPYPQRKAFKDLSPEEQLRIKQRADEIRDYFKKFSITEILVKLGAIQSPQRPEYWKIEGFGIVKIDNLKWEKHKQLDVKGYNGISLVQTVHNFKFQSEAIKWLKTHFKVPPSQPKEKKEKPVDNEQVLRAKRAEENRIKKEKRDKLIEELKSIDIKLVLAALGGIDGQDGDPTKWKLPGSGNIITKGQSWKNVNNEKKGFGGIGLVMMQEDLPFMEAAQWLVNRFGETISEDMKGDLNIQEKKDFTPPTNAPYYINIVRNYLTNERGLPPILIDKLITEGKIYADPNKRCVFISQAAAELRSTGVEENGEVFKGCCIGSQTDFSGFRVMFEKNANEETIALVEAAIDSLSYNAMFPGRFALSTNGSGRFLLQYKITTEALDNEWKLKAAFDADWAGDYAAQKLFNAIFIREVLPEMLDVNTETVDEWILDTNITFKILNSPHMNFFNEGWEAIKDKYVEVDSTNEKGEPTTIMENHGDKSEPEIHITVGKNLHPLLTKGEKILKVSLDKYEYIINELGLARERPVNSKDWNEDMILLGSKFLMDYEECAKKEFTQVPELPDYLVQYHKGIPSENVKFFHKKEVNRNKPKI